MLGCTRPNPRSCSDGLCTDQRYPFCDVDGSLEGTPQTCISVSCNPGEFAACRGDLAITCNSTGNDYDLITCELGCDPTNGCRSCASNDQCANPTPVCDSTSSTCRACVLDDECSSQVCDDGACLPESAVVYAHPNGSSTSSCTLNEPCLLTRATTLATSSAVPAVLRLLPGVYPGTFVVGPTNAQLHVVATGATIAGQIGARIVDGANVDIRGLSTNTTDQGIICDSSTTSRSALKLRNVVLRSGGSGTTLIVIGNCTAQLLTSDLDSGSGNTGGPIFLNSYGVVVADRVHFHAVGGKSIMAFGERIDVIITNSVLDNVLFNWSTTDTGPPGSSVRVAFSTMLYRASGSLYCVTNGGSSYRMTVYENNVMTASNATSIVNGTDCTLFHNILFPQPSPPATNMAVDPQFVDAAAGDFHLKSTSPAIDAAVPNLVPPSADFDGTSRPQGAQSDLGAFELKP